MPGRAPTRTRSPFPSPTSTRSSPSNCVFTPLSRSGFSESCSSSERLSRSTSRMRSKERSNLFSAMEKMRRSASAMMASAPPTSEYASSDSSRSASMSARSIALSRMISAHSAALRVSVAVSQSSLIYLYALPSLNRPSRVSVSTRLTISIERLVLYISSIAV